MGEFDEISNSPLNKDKQSIEEFDDEFEEDVMDKKLMVLATNHVATDAGEFNTNEDLDLLPSRWSIYDAFSGTLEKYRAQCKSVKSFPSCNHLFCFM